jgi:hypothetical protein
MTDSHPLPTHATVSVDSVTPSKPVAPAAPRRPLSLVESNTHTVRALSHTPLKACAHSAHAASLAAPLPPAAKASPGLLRGFFELISPEMKRIRSVDGAAATSEVDARQLECDETLGPIPIYLDAAEQNQMNFSTIMQPDRQQDPPAQVKVDRAPMKSPMSTLLSAVQPTGGLSVDLPTPRGLSFTFGDLHSPLTVTPFQAADNGGNGQGTPGASNPSRGGRSESRASQDTLVSPPPPLSQPSHSDSSAFAAPSPRFSCSECTKSFPSNSALAMHLLVHSGEKPFACPQKGCNKRFRQKGHLVSHYRKHTGEKPFLCPGSDCSKRFKDKSGLNTHVKRQHPGVSATHVTASTPDDADDSTIDPALEAAIAEANITLQALQSSTLAAAGRSSSAAGPPPKKRTHAAMRMSTPSLITARSLSPLTTAASDHAVMEDVDAAAGEAEAEEEEGKERELENLVEPVTKKQRDEDSPSAPAARVSTSLHMNLPHHDRAASAGHGHGSFSPLTAPSPVSFSNHLAMRESRSGHSTPTGFSAGWMPQVPLPAPVVAHTFTHMANAQTAHHHAHFHSFLPPHAPHAPQTNSLTPTNIHSHLFNPSVTSAFSFKATPTLASTAAAL